MTEHKSCVFCHTDVEARGREFCLVNLRGVRTA